MRPAARPIGISRARDRASLSPVCDSTALAAMRRLWADLRQVIEPSSATVLAALLHHRERFAGRRVGLILSGGNVDLDAIAFCARCGAAG
jgi:threonine dehydratase